MFLKRTIGSMEISESGIVMGEDGCSKVYLLSDCRACKDIAAFCGKFRRKEIEYDFLFIESESYLVVHYAGKNMHEAAAWFEALEQEYALKGWNAEQRLAHYRDFLGKILSEKIEPENCILQPELWKNAALYGGMETVNGEIETKAGVYRIVAVRRFLAKPAHGAIKILQEQTGSKAAYVSVIPVSDQAVADFIRSEYVGLESVMPRLKRNNPVLHSILMQEDQAVKDEQKFLCCGAYFLLAAADKEEMEKTTAVFKEESRRLGLLVEVMPLATLNTTVELKKTLAVFGLMGGRQRRYHSILASEELAVIVEPEEGFNEQNEMPYDIEEMRELFFKKEVAEE